MCSLHVAGMGLCVESPHHNKPIKTRQLGITCNHFQSTADFQRDLTCYRTFWAKNLLNLLRPKSKWFVYLKFFFFLCISESLINILFLPFPRICVSCHSSLRLWFPWPWHRDLHTRAVVHLATRIASSRQ